jgi:autotransporter-associated beta strand protein
MKPRKILTGTACSAALIVAAGLCPRTHAASGTWTQLNTGGNWSGTGNWGGATVADASGFSADFSTLNLVADNKVFLDGARTLTTLSFGDADTSSAASWALSGSKLTLAGTTPTITVGPLGPAKSVTISAEIAGTVGLIKAGTGTLNLASANVYSGITKINDNGGNLLVTHPAALGTSTLTIGSGSGGLVGGTLQLANNIAITSVTAVTMAQARGLISSGASANIENLSGNNSLSANLTLNSTGGSSVNVLSTAGTLTLGGILKANERGFVFSGAGNSTVSGTVVDTIAVTSRTSITKLGTGTLTLSGTNTYTLGTTVSAGTLNARSSSALGGGNVTVAVGATLNHLAAANTSLAIGGTLGVTGGVGTTLGTSIGSTATGAQINVTGAATLSNAALKLNLYGVPGASHYSGLVTLIHGGVGSSLNPATAPTLGFVYNNTDFTVGEFTRSATDLQVTTTAATALGSAYWKGGLTNAANVWAASNGSTQSNWTETSGGVDQALSPGLGADVTVASSSGAATLGADMTLKSLTISDAANGLNLNADGSTLTIAGAAGITMNNDSGTATTIAANVNLGVNQTWTNSNTNNALTISGAVSMGAFSLTKAGSGNLVLSGVNTGTGNTIISAGTLTLGGSGLFGATLSNAGALVANSSAPQTLSGIISGAGTVTQSGSGVLVLSGANTYSGGTTISSGSVTIGLNSVLSGGLVTSGALGVGAVTLANGVTLSPDTSNRTLAAPTFTFNGDVNIGTYNTATRLLLDGAIELGGGTRTLTLFRNSAATSFVGSSNSGKEAFKLQQQAGGPAVTVANGTLRLAADASVASTFTFAQLDKAADGTALSFVGNSGLTIGNRVIAIARSNEIFGNGSNTGPRLTMESGGYLSLNNGFNLSTSASVFSLSGAGTVTNLDTDGATSNGNISTLSITGSDTTTFSGTLANGSNLNSALGITTDTGSIIALTHAGSGTLILTGNNTYSGATTVNNGKLVVNGSISTSSLTTVNVGGALGGSGTVGAMTIASGGLLAPGNSPGILSAGNTSLEGGSTLSIEMSDSTVGTGYDQLAVTGTLSLAGLLEVNLGSYVPTENTMFFILANDNSDAIAGAFSNAPIDGGSYHFGGQEFQISYFGDSVGKTFSGGNDVVLMVIPEPAAALLGSLGLLGLLRRRRDGFDVIQRVPQRPRDAGKVTPPSRIHTR